MLREMNRLMQDSAFVQSISDESRWFALNQLESFVNESLTRSERELERPSVQAS